MFDKAAAQGIEGDRQTGGDRGNDAGIASVSNLLINHEQA